MRLPSRSPASVLAPLACLVLVAATCPRDPGPPRPGPTASPSATSAPSGVLRLGYPEEPPSLDPLEASSPAARDILRAVLPSFHIVTPGSGYELSLLAEEPVVRTDGRRMTVGFRLRPDARWSDGRPITVEDVRFTWRAIGERGTNVSGGFGNVDAIERISDTEGTIVLATPSTAWRELFSAGRFVLPAPPDGDVEAALDWERGPPVAGGPFRIARWERGLRVRLEPNPEWFGPAPAVAAIEVTFVPDATTALQLLEAGRLDAVASYLAPGWSRRLEAMPGVAAASAFGPTLVQLLVAGGVPRADRRAIADSIDRERFVDAVVRGDGRPADGILVEGQAGAVDAWSRYDGRDAPRVRSDRELRLIHVRGELMDILGRYVQAEAERAGADVELVALDADLFHDEWLPRGRFELALWEARSGPAPRLSRWFSPRAEERVTSVNDPRLFALTTEVDRPGPAGEAALREAQELLAELAAVVPMFQPAATMGWRDGVSGIAPNPTADGPLWNAETWRLPEP